jgi:hypothetical protein
MAPPGDDGNPGDKGSDGWGGRALNAERESIR